MKLPASDYIGASLNAKKAVKLYTSPDGTITGERLAGEYVGTIYSYVVRNGVLWWQLTNGLFVKHAENTFDVSMTGSIKEQRDKELQEQMNDPLKRIEQGVSDIFSGVGKTFQVIGNSLPLIVLVVLVAFIILIYNKKITI